MINLFEYFCAENSLKVSFWEIFGFFDYFCNKGTYVINRYFDEFEFMKSKTIIEILTIGSGRSAVK